MCTISRKKKKACQVKENEGLNLFAMTQEKGKVIGDPGG